MHRSGVLGAIIPEFGNLHARVLHDLYHIYTVDRHSLAAVRELERLRSGEYKKNNSLLTEVAREVDSLPLVFLALLLHDIGKGHGHDHHERGARLTAEVCQRLGLNNEEIDVVVFLVREHPARAGQSILDQQRWLFPPAFACVPKAEPRTAAQSDAIDT
jgi:[protein-PII] uridylyltransferase